MTQKEYAENIEACLELYYNVEEIPWHDRVEAFKIALKWMRSYEREHKKDYKHKFFNKWIEMTDEVLKNLEKMLEYEQ